MSSPSSSMRHLAQQLLAASRSSPSARGATGGSQMHEKAVAVFETLRTAVTKFAGPDGYGALLRRALVLARAEAPALQSARVGAKYELEGLEDVAGSKDGAESVVALTAHLLTLLATFIGEPLTLRLLREGELGPQLDS